MSPFKPALLVTLFAFLTGCMMVQPISIERSQQASWQGEQLTINARFNELLAHQLTLNINGQQVLQRSLGNPQFPEYSEAAYQQRVPYEPVNTNWQGHKLSVQCHQGIWAELLKYPVCTLLLDQQPLTEFNFNRP